MTEPEAVELTPAEFLRRLADVVEGRDSLRIGQVLSYVSCQHGLHMECVYYESNDVLIERLLAVEGAFQEEP